MIRIWSVLSITLVALSVIGSAVEAAVEVQIISPEPGIPAYGSIVLEARVESSERIVQVEVFVDGARAARFSKPPYRISLDLGQGNLEHSFRVLAIGRSGARAADPVGESVATRPRVRGSGPRWSVAWTRAHRAGARVGSVSAVARA